MYAGYMKEQWMSVPGLPTHYEVSNQGRVRSLDHKDGLGRTWQGKLLRLHVVGWGYLTFHPYTADRRRPHYVHRAVLEAFVGPCPHGHQARHLNSNPRDNRLANLAWGTAAEDGEDRRNHTNVVRGGRHQWAVLTATDVRTIRRRLAAGDLQKHIARDYGIGQTTVSHIKRRTSWGHL